MAVRGRTILVLRPATCRAAVLVVIGLSLLVPLSVHLSREQASRHVSAVLPCVAMRVVVIDPGHGGRDPGKVGAGVLEKNITLAVSFRLAELVRLAGGTAVLTRLDDRDLSELMPGDGTRKRREIEYRLKAALEARGDVLVSVHANASRSSVWHGAQVFFNREQGGDPSAELARLVQEELCRQLGTTRQESSRINQYLLQHAPMPAVTVEIGFLTNPSEASRLVQPEYQQRVAWAIFCGIARYFHETDALVLGRPAIGQDNW